MKKGIKGLFLLIAMFTLIGLVACKDDNSGKDYKIDVDAISQRTGEYGETFTAEIPLVLDKKGKKVAGVEASVISVTNEEGDNLNVTRGRFLPGAVGLYTITYGVKDLNAVPQATLIIEIKDTTPPVMTVTSMATSAFVNQEVNVPTFELDDLSGGDLSKEEIIIKDPDNLTVTITDGKFIVTKPGTYVYVVTQYDIYNNSVTKEYDLVVADIVKVDDRIGYFNDEFGLNQVRAFGPWQDNQQLKYQTNIKHGTDEGAIELSKATNAISSMGITITPMINDWSNYDYIGYWFYNANDVGARVYISLTTQQYGDGIIVAPKSWQFIAIDTRRPISTEVLTTQDIEDIQEFTVFIQELESTNVTLGSKYYFGSVDGYNYDEHDDRVARLDTPAGTMNMGLSSDIMKRFNIKYTSEVHREDEAGSFEYEMVKAVGDSDDVTIEGWVNLFHLRNESALYSDFTVWINNPNNFEIRVHSNQGNPVQVIPANSSIDYTINVGSNGKVVIMIQRPSGDFLPVGAKYHIGAVRGKTKKVVVPGVSLDGTGIITADIETDKEHTVVYPIAKVDGVPNNSIIIDLIVTDPDGEIVSIIDNKFTPTKEGIYKFTYSALGATDYVVNITAYKVVEYTEGENVLSHVGSGVTVARAYNDPALAAINYQTTIKRDEDLGAVRFDMQKSSQNFGFEVVALKTNWTSYDYIGFWFYNGKAQIVEVFPFGNSSLQRTEARPNAWTFIGWDLKAIEIQDGANANGTGAVQDLSAVERLGVIIATIGSTWKVNHDVGDYFLVSPIRGYNYVNADENGVVRFDEQVGTGALGLVSSSRIGYHTATYVTDVKNDGEAGATKFEVHNDFLNLIIQIPYFRNIENVDEVAYYMWVNNPNDFEIAVNGKKVAANNSAVVQLLLSLKSTEQYGPRMGIQVKKGDGSNLGEGAVVYFGKLYKENVKLLELESEIPGAVNLNQEIELPEAIAKINGIIDEDAVITIEVRDFEGEEVIIIDNKFTPTKEGIYTITYQATEYGELNFEIKVGMPLTEGENVLDNISGAEIISGGDKATGVYQWDVKHFEDKGAYEVTVTIEGPTRIDVISIPQNKDWSSYDYVGYWFYNDSNAVLKMGSFGNDFQVTPVHPGQKIFISWPTATVAMYSENVTAYPSTNIANYRLKIETNEGSATLEVGSKFYIGALRGYNWETAEETVLIHTDELGGLAYVNQYGGPRFTEFNINYNGEIKAAGELGTLEFNIMKTPQSDTNKIMFFVAPQHIKMFVGYANQEAFPAVGEAGIYYVDKSQSKQTFIWDGSEYIQVTLELKVNVYNPNTFDIKVDQAGTVVKAGSWQEVPLNFDWFIEAGQSDQTRLIIPIGKTDDTAFSIGDKVNVGAIRLIVTPKIEKTLELDGTIPSEVDLNQEIELPEAIAKINGIIDEDAVITIEVRDFEGEEVIIIDNKFTPTKEGIYTITYQATEYGELNFEIKVGMPLTEGENVLDNISGAEIISGGDKATGVYQWDVKHFEDKGAYEVTVTIEGPTRIDVISIPQNKDWSSYDYVGYWFYNDSNAVLKMGSFGNDFQVTPVHPGQKIFISWPTATVAMYSENVTAYPSTNIANYRLKIETNAGSATLEVGSKFYIGALRGYNWETAEETVLIHTDELGGLAYVNQYGGPRFTEFNINYNGEIKAAGELGTLEFNIMKTPQSDTNKIMFFVAPQHIKMFVGYANQEAFPAVGEAGIYYVDKSQSKQTFIWDGSEYIQVTLELKVNVYNPNTFDIKVDQAGTVVKAGSWQEVPLNFDWFIEAGQSDQTRLIIPIGKTDDTAFSIGDKVNVGAIRLIVTPKIEKTLELDGTIPSEVDLNQEIELPEAIAKINGIIDEDAVITIEVRDFEGEEVIIIDNKFTPTKEGIYTITYQATEYGELNFEIKVGMPLTEGENVLDNISGAEIISGGDKATGVYQWDVKHFEDKGAYEVTVTIEGPTRIDVISIPQNKDWSSYDYVGYWFYNDSNAVLKMGSFGNDFQVTPVHPGQKIFISWPTATVAMYSENVTAYPSTNIANYRLKIETNAGSATLEVGSKFYIGALRGYNWETAEETVLIHTDELGGLAYVNQYGGPRFTEFNINYNGEIKAAGELGTLEFNIMKTPQSDTNKIMFFVAPQHIKMFVGYANQEAFPAVGEAGIYYVDKSQSKQTFIWDGSEYIQVTLELKVNVYNPNTFDIKVDQAGTVVKAGSWQEVPLNFDWFIEAGQSDQTRLIIPIGKTDDTAFSIGDKVNVGAIRLIVTPK